MKKIVLLLLFFLLSAIAVSADSVRFDNMRTVVIADTTQDNYAARYMKRAWYSLSASPIGTASTPRLSYLRRT